MKYNNRILYIYMDMYIYIYIYYIQWLNKKYTYKLYICIPTICLEKHIFISVIIVRIELDTFWRSFGQNGECRNQPKWGI